MMYLAQQSNFSKTKANNTKPEVASDFARESLATISLIALIAISFTLSIVHTTHTNKPNITDAQINALYEQDQRGEITLSQEQINNLNALDHLN